jgi:hypothetical protein
MRGVALLAATAALCSAVWTASPPTAFARACGLPGYGYAGVLSTTAAGGVAATVSALARPSVRGGHVAAWVGVGGYGMGPGGSDEWIQAGITATTSSSQRVYIEWKRPQGRPHLVVLERRLGVGEERRVAVRELPGRRSVWRAYLDGRAVGPAVHLPGSHGRFPAMAVAESWDGARAVCNRFSYRFASLSIVPARATRSGTTATIELEDPGYVVERRERATFVARSRR